MNLTTEQLRSDRSKMVRFICERIPADGTTVILVRDGGDPAWADLYPSWDDEGGWDLRIETNEPEWIGLKAVYDHFRRQEMTWGEWTRKIDADMGKLHVPTSVGYEVGPLRDASKGQTHAPTEAQGLIAGKATLTVIETASILGCSYGEARKRMLEGRIQAIKDGRWLRTRREWVEEYVARKTIQPVKSEAAIHSIPLPSSKRKTQAKVKAGGIGHRFLKNRSK